MAALRVAAPEQQIVGLTGYSYCLRNKDDQGEALAALVESHLNGVNVGEGRILTLGA